MSSGTPPITQKPDEKQPAKEAYAGRSPPEGSSSRKDKHNAIQSPQHPDQDHSGNETNPADAGVTINAPVDQHPPPGDGVHEQDGDENSLQRTDSGVFADPLDGEHSDNEGKPAETGATATAGTAAAGQSDVPPGETSFTDAQGQDGGQTSNSEANPAATAGTAAARQGGVQSGEPTSTDAQGQDGGETSSPRTNSRAPGATANAGGASSGQRYAPPGNLAYSDAQGQDSKAEGQDNDEASSTYSDSPVPSESLDLYRSHSDNEANPAETGPTGNAGESFSGQNYIPPGEVAVSNQDGGEGSSTHPDSDPLAMLDQLQDLTSQLFNQMGEQPDTIRNRRVAQVLGYNLQGLESLTKGEKK